LNGNRIKLFSRIGLCPKIKNRTIFILEGDESTFQQKKHNPNKITKPIKEQWDQSDIQLANYAQNDHQVLLLEKSGGIVRSGYRTCLIHPENFPKFKSFFPTLILELRDTKLDKT
jgi:hypothetical protein